MNVISEIINHLRNYFPKENSVLLDIGCGSPNHLFYINEKIGFSKIYGVDSGFNVFKSNGLDVNDSVYFETDYEGPYGLMWKMTQKGELLEPLISKSEFDEKFEFIELSIDDFIKSESFNDHKFDFIILSCILHLKGISNLITVLDHLIDHLSENGLMYVKVGNYLHPQKEYLNVKSNNEWESILNRLEIILNLGRSGSIYYEVIGKKKGG